MKSDQSTLLQLEVQEMYKYGTIYQKVLEIPRVDGTKNILINLILKTARESGLGHIIHECPYNVSLLKLQSFYLDII